MGQKISVADLRKIHEEHKRWLSTVGAEGRCADLCEAKLSGVKLSQVNLSKANMNSVDLSSANLWGIILKSTNLKGANLRGTYLLHGADLTGADMSEADLTKANLSKAELGNVKLIKANLYKTKLSGANLSGADMSDADLSKTKLRQTKLSGANLQNACLIGVDLKDAGDLFNIYTRLAGKSMERAKDTASGILASTEALNANYPQGVPEQMLKAETDPYKFITVGFYKILYSIVEDTVVVEAIYHLRQILRGKPPPIRTKMRSSMTVSSMNPMIPIVNTMPNTLRNKTTLR